MSAAGGVGGAAVLGNQTCQEQQPGASRPSAVEKRHPQHVVMIAYAPLAMTMQAKDPGAQATAGNSGSHSRRPHEVYESRRRRGLADGMGTPGPSQGKGFRGKSRGPRRRSASGRRQTTAARCVQRVVGSQHMWHRWSTERRYRFGDLWCWIQNEWRARSRDICVVSDAYITAPGNLASQLLKNPPAAFLAAPLAVNLLSRFCSNLPEL